MARRYSSVTWTEICAFWGMVIAGFTHFFGGFFRALVKWAFDDGNVARILNRIADICTLLGNIALLVAIALLHISSLNTRLRAGKCSIG